MQSRFIGRRYLIDRLFNPVVMENLEFLREQALDVNPDNLVQYEDYNPEILEPKEALWVERLFVDDIYNERFTLDYIKFRRTAVSIYDTDSYVDYSGYVRGIKHKKRVYEVAIPPIYQYLDLLTRMHEFSHYLNYKKCPKMFYDYLKTEVHSIFMEQLFHDYCLKKNYLTDEDNVTWYYHLNSIIGYLQITDYDYKSVITENRIGTSYDTFIMKVLYYYGYVYANKLYELYLNDEKKFLKRYMGIYHGDCLESICNYYDIDIEKYDTLEPTIKRIRSVKEDSNYVK